MKPHVVDRAFARWAAREPMFAGGWGDEAWLERTLAEGVSLGDAVVVDEVAGSRATGDVSRRDFAFTSPRGDLGLPPGVATARLSWLSPLGRDRRTPPRNVALVLAGSREEGYRLRDAIWRPLVGEGIDVLFLENPYYGTRRAAGQRSASLSTVADQLRMNLATVAEVAAVVSWLEQLGCRNICVTGYSMGGAMAAMAGAYVRRPLALVPIAAGLSPAPIYTEGLLSQSVDFRALGETCGGPGQARAKLARIFDAASLAHAPRPVCSDAIVLVACKRDGYVPTRETEALARQWACPLRWIDAGHVSAVFTGRREMRRAVRDALAARAR